MTPTYAVFWFKRDLRLEDNPALTEACRSGYPVLAVYVAEPSLLADTHYSDRHFRFISGSLREIDRQLQAWGSALLVVKEEAVAFFEALHNFAPFVSLHSHRETGIARTFERDKIVARWCRSHRIPWKEVGQNGIQRGLQHREEWMVGWEHYMNQPVLRGENLSDSFIPKEFVQKLQQVFSIWNHPSEALPGMQPGGRSKGLAYLKTFLEERHRNYAKHISKPEASRTSCSRLSPYIAWGNLSVREVIQAGHRKREEGGQKRALDGFLSRLRWQSHFIQKFESECRMEFESVNRAYQKLEKRVDENLLKAWEDGMTGFPLVDAAMRCLKATGYINFRMRALLVSFATHMLWLPWQCISHFLASQFLDFEPGIHFPQLQMQAGETGVNQIRIYNPIKNSLEHDPEGIFIKKWVPEIAHLPLPALHQPWTLTYMEQQFYHYEPGTTYPTPVVHPEESRKHASDILYAFQKRPDTRKESRRILVKHTMRMSNDERRMRNGS